MTKENTNKISTCLWFDTQAKDAATFYTSVFSELYGSGQAEITNVTHYISETPSDKPVGSAMTVAFELHGQTFTALNGGPHFKFTPAISFLVNCETKEEVDKLWKKLSEGGETLMPLDSYPFSERYGWTKDKFGLSWQIILTNPEGDWRPKIIPSMMFVNDNAGNAKDAMQFYTSVFEDAEISDNVNRYPAGMEPDKEGTIMYADFSVDDQWFAVMDSAQDHDFNFNEAVSFMVNCENQEEIDYYWEKLSAVPESEQCGWLKDKYGVSWQIVPDVLPELFGSDNPEKGKRTMEAMLQMKKLDIEALRNA